MNDTGLFVPARTFKPSLGRAAPDAAPYGANDDEFDDGTLDSAWTEVQRSGDTNAWTERYAKLFYRHKDQSGGTDLHVLLKTITPSTGDYLEAAVDFTRMADFAGPCLVMADGTTFGSGSQVALWLHVASGLVRARLQTITNFNSITSDGSAVDLRSGSPIYMRLKYVSSNTWGGYVSGDGFEWQATQTNYSRTLSPTKVGLGVLHFSSLAPTAFSTSFHYWRYNPANES